MPNYNQPPQSWTVMPSYTPGQVTTSWTGTHSGSNVPDPDIVHQQKVLVYFDSDNGTLVLKRGNQEFALVVQDLDIQCDFKFHYDHQDIMHNISISLHGQEPTSEHKGYQQAQEMMKVIEVTKALESSS